MRLSLPDLERVATQVVDEEPSDLKILAAMRSEGGSAYAELLVGDRALDARVSRIIIGVDRTADATDIKRMLRARFRAHRRGKGLLQLPKNRSPENLTL